MRLLRGGPSAAQRPSRQWEKAPSWTLFFRILRTISTHETWTLWFSKRVLETSEQWEGRGDTASGGCALGPPGGAPGTNATTLSPDRKDDFLWPCLQPASRTSRTCAEIRPSRKLCPKARGPLWLPRALFLGDVVHELTVQGVCTPGLWRDC